MIRSLGEDVRSLLRSGVAISSLTQCVDELVVNSLDAGATCITVRVDVPSLRIQISDNGSGISRDDLDVLGERYATSKCHSLNDLENIKSYGFRGEALASIRDIAGIFEIVTRHKSSYKTYCKMFRSGKALKVTESCVPRSNVGTTMTAYDVFSSLPVRRKLISNVFDFEKIRQRLASIALINPGVSFSLYNDETGQNCLSTRKCHSVSSTFSQLFGNLKAKSLQEVSFKSGLVKVSGYICLLSHHSKSLQFIYVNGRLLLKTKLHKLVNQVLNRSLLLKRPTLFSDKEQSQEDQLKSPAKQGIDKYGIFVLNISCPIMDYDITLEPAKTLVEFEDWEAILDVVKKCIQSFLIEHNLLLITDEESPELSQTEDSNDSQVDLSIYEYQSDVTETSKYSIHPSNIKKSLQSSVVSRNTNQYCNELCEDEANEPTEKEMSCSHNQVLSTVTPRKKFQDGPVDRLLPTLNEKSRNLRQLSSSNCFTSPNPITLKSRRTQKQKISKIEHHKTKTSSNNIHNNSVFDSSGLSVKSTIIQPEPSLGQGKSKSLENLSESNRELNSCSISVRTETCGDEDIHEQALEFICRPSVSKDVHITDAKDPRQPLVIHQSLVSQQREAPGQPLVSHQRDDIGQSLVSHQREDFGQPIVSQQREAPGQPLVSHQSEDLGQPLVSHQRDDTGQSLLPQQREDSGQQLVSHESEHPGHQLVSYQREILVKPFVSEREDPGQQLASHQLGDQEKPLVSHESEDPRQSLVYHGREVPEQTLPFHQGEGVLLSNKNMTLPSIIGDSRVIISDNLSESSPSTVDKDCQVIFDNNLQRNIYFNYRTGNTWFKCPVSCDDDAENIENQKNSNPGNCIKPVPLSCAPHISFDCTPWLPRPDRQQKHQPTDDAACSSVVGQMLNEWENPVFKSAFEMDVTTLSKPTVFRNTVSLYNAVCPYRFTKEMVNSLHVIQQVDDKFIICKLQQSDSDEQDSLIVSLDQHAVHERIRLEKLISDILEKKSQDDKSSLPRVKSSAISPPIELEFRPDELLLLKRFRCELQRVGVKFIISSELSGPHRVIVHELPCAFVEREMSETRRRRPSVAVGIVKELLDTHIEHLKQTNGVSPVIPKTIYRVLSSQACHGAIKFGEHLSTKDCEQLIQQLSTCNLPFQCAHGRPSIIPLVDLKLLKTKQLHSQMNRKPPKLQRLTNMKLAEDIKVDI